MVRWGAPLAAVILLCIGFTSARAAAAGCSERLLGRATTTQAEVSARAVIELRDFGGMDNRVGGTAPFAVSPDRQWIALILRQADTETDRYCMGVVLISLHDTSPPRLLDVGGEFISMVADTHGIPDLPNGAPALITPAWSPDSRWLAYLRRDAQVTQAWVSPIDGGSARKLSSLITDARSVRWSADGAAVLVTTRPGLAPAEHAIDHEGQSGFHYDARFWPMFEDRPRPRLPLPITAFAYDLNSGQILSQGGYRESAEADGLGKPAAALLYARSVTGARAWTQQSDPSLFIGPARLHVAVQGRELSCPPDLCASGVGGLWWIGPTELLFIRSAGSQGGGGDALYLWNISRNEGPKRLLLTNDALFGCQLANTRLYCAAEGARVPRHVEAIDVRSGARHLVYDPNRGFPTARLGTVTRLRWRIGAESATYADLVLPPEHRSGEHHPLIVVQYDSRGFLRGGTGDEDPIFVLAAHGYAVLSFQQPGFLPAALRAHDFAAFQHTNMAGFAGRKFLAAALQGGIDAAIARGVIDVNRIGLTGLSDGAITAQFLLAHPNRFKAAALSTCCDDPSIAMFSAGLSYRDMVLASGYPAPGKDKRGFWQSYSVAVNAAQMRTPLLLQVPDREYRLALETYNSLQLAGAPVDMYVFADERHIKWHPAHRLAIYNRVLAWFDFWLRGRAAPSLADPEELARWRLIKAAVPNTP